MADGTNTGGCLCGNVKYVAKDVKAAGKCYCVACQKATGGSCVTVVAFADADVKITGKTQQYTYTADSGNPVTMTFCPTCASLMYYSNDKAFPGLTLILAGTMDDSSAIKPQFIQFAGNRPSWDGDIVDAPHFPKMAG